MDSSDHETVLPDRIESSKRAQPAPPDEPRMAGLARWLIDQGQELPGRAGTGSRVDPGHSPTSTPRSARWLVHGPGIIPDDPDSPTAREARPIGPSDADLVRRLLIRGPGAGLAVAGRRQGRLAAAMIGWTLVRAGLDPTVLLRAGASQLGGTARAGMGREVVVDIGGVPEVLVAGPPGPSLAVILDDDRFAAPSVLDRVVESVGPGGLVLVADPAGVRDAAPGGSTAAVESLSLERGGAWWGTDLREDRGRFRFRAFHRGQFAVEVRLRVPGRSSILSALAAVAACGRIEVPTREIKEALEDFEGISRGFESRGGFRGATLIDDDAAEPAELAEVLSTARAIHGRRRLWVVFAPAGPPSIEAAASLLGADRLTIVGVPFDSVAWADMLERTGTEARHAPRLDDALSDLDRNLEPGDVLLTLGAADVGTIADAFLRRLPGNRQGR